MPGTILFVHGTSVRDDGYQKTLEKIRNGVWNVGIRDAEFPQCSWGEAHGIETGLISDTLPNDEGLLAVSEAPSAMELDVALWTYLLLDPMFEINLVTGQAQGAGSTSFLGERIAALGSADFSTLDLDGTGLTTVDLNEARTKLSPRLDAIASSTVEPLSNDEVAAMLARALIAQTALLEHFSEMGTEPTAVLNRAIRDTLVSEIAATMSPDGVETFVGIPGGSLVVRRALLILTNYIRDRRTPLMVERVGPFVGDILLYQRRGEQMLEFVTESLRNATPPVIAIGHSLGGIMLVDLLSRPNPPRIDYLITAGSQSPFFYAIDALDTLRPGESNKIDVPWLNLYDRNDLLSFLAANVFESSDAVIEDKEME